jgi:hypothetical protein
MASDDASRRVQPPDGKTGVFKTSVLMMSVSYGPATPPDEGKEFGEGTEWS